MDSLISTFHIDIKLLLAQMVNFGIVFTILWWGALKPLMRIMRDREQRIGKSLEDAEQLEKRLKELDVEYEKKMQEARARGVQILEEADRAAEERVKEAVVRARRETEQVVEEARAKIEDQRRRVVDEAKRDLAEVMMQAMEKVLVQKIDAKQDKILVEEVLEKMTSKK